MIRTGFISTLTILFITASSLIPLISTPSLKPLIQSVLGTSTSVYVTGKVIDIRGGNIMGATVSMSNSTYSTTQYTTSAGFAFIVPGNATYTLRASKSGFKPSSINVTVGTKPVSNIVLTLQASTPPPSSNNSSGSSNTSNSGKTGSTTQNSSGSQTQNQSQSRTISGAVNIVDSSGNIKGPYTQGAKITIDNGQGGVKTITTDSRGTFTFTSNAITPNLTYTVTLQPIPGYTIVSQNPLSRSLQPGVHTTAYFRIKANNQSGSSNSSSETSKSKTISGHVYLANAAGTPYTSYTGGAKIRITNTATGKSGSTTTDQNGYYIFNNLASGKQTYTISLTLPTGYTAVSATSFTTTVSDGKNSAIDFIIRKANDSSNSSITKTISGHIYTVDASGKVIGTYGGATIHITNNQGGTSEDIKADGDGYYIFTSKAKGTATYTIELKKIANFTIVSEPKFTKTVNEGDNIIVNFSVRKTEYNGNSNTTPLKITMTTTVVDEKGNKLPFISITACSSTVSGDGTNVESCIKGQTNSSGYVNLSVPSNSKLTVSLEGIYNGSKYSGKDIVYTKDSNRSVTLKAIKESNAFDIYGFIWYDKDNDKSADEVENNHDGGFDFDGLRLFLRKDDNSYGKEFKTVWIKSGHGYFQFSGLKAGQYTLTLQDIPKGYQLITPSKVNLTVPPNQYVNFIVQKTSNSSSTSEKNERKYKISGHVYVDTNKNFHYDSKDAVVAGVEIRVLHGPSVTAATKSISNGNGEYALTYLPPALYTLQLSSTLEGFQVASNYATVNLQNQNVILNWELKETTTSTPSKNATMWIDGRVTIRTNEGKKSYKGAKISLTSANGKTLVATTDDSGYYKFNNLGGGRYTVEFASPKNAVLESERKVYTFLSFSQPNQALYWTIASLPSQGQNQAPENNSPAIVPTKNKKIVANVWIINGKGQAQPYQEEYGRITIQAFNDNGQHRTAEKIGNGSYEIVPLVMNHYTVKIKLPNTLTLASNDNLSVTFSDSSKEEFVDFYVRKK